MKAVFDTNILFDCFDEVASAKQELAKYSLRQISVITLIQVMVGCRDKDEECSIRGFLATFEVLEVSSEVARQAVSLRGQLRLKITDAIVYATARA